MKHYFTRGGTRTNFYTLAEWLKALEPFKTANGNFRGGPPEDNRCGWLQSDEPNALLFKMRVDMRLIDYVVYSYSTPLVWHDKETGWQNPGHSYSPTTAGKHYGPTVTALSVMER